MNSLTYIVVSSLLGGGVVYFIQSRIRVKEAQDMAGIQAEATTKQTPYTILQQQLAVKDGQFAATQAKHDAFVDSTIARQDATTKAILELAEQVRVQTGNLKDLGQGMQDHRAESSARAGKIYEQIGKVNERLAGLESGIKTSIDLAGRAAETAEKAVKAARA